MQYVDFEMEVVHFALPLLAFFRKTGPKVPILRGRPLRPAPLRVQIYEIFRPKARNVKTQGRRRRSALRRRRSTYYHAALSAASSAGMGSDGIFQLMLKYTSKPEILARNL